MSSLCVPTETTRRPEGEISRRIVAGRGDPLLDTIAQTIGDVLTHRAAQHRNLLRNVADFAVERVETHLPQIHSVHGDEAVLRVVEPNQHPCERALARTVWANAGD